MLMDFPLYRHACRVYEQEWSLVDRVLYDMCERYPDHAHLLHVNAKLMIVGRTYATGVERAVGGTGALERLSRHLCKHHADVDNIITSLKRADQPFDPSRLQQVLNAHATLGRIVRQVTRDKMSARSFVSKYLHFHCPVVPIYDQYAEAQARKLYRWRPGFDVFTPSPDIDTEYYWFVCRFWQLYLNIQRAGIASTVKELDYFLLYSRNPGTPPGEG